MRVYSSNDVGFHQVRREHVCHHVGKSIPTERDPVLSLDQLTCDVLAWNGLVLINAYKSYLFLAESLPV